jgi:hypothetical protein
MISYLRGVTPPPELRPPRPLAIKLGRISRALFRFILQFASCTGTAPKIYYQFGLATHQRCRGATLYHNANSVGRILSFYNRDEGWRRHFSNMILALRTRLWLGHGNDGTYSSWSRWGDAEFTTKVSGVACVRVGKGEKIDKFRMSSPRGRVVNVTSRRRVRGGRMIARR